MGFDRLEGLGLRALLEEAGYEPDFRWAWDHYEPVVKGLSQRLGLRRLCEIGGGRNPLLSLREVAALGASYTVNDISAGELALVPDGFETACFDVAGDPAALPPRSPSISSSRAWCSSMYAMSRGPGAIFTSC
jgi:hypothetical protein